VDVDEAIRTRKSVRKYEQRPIAPETLSELLEAARLAPSSNNRQAWTMIVVQDDELKERLAKASGNQEFVAECSAYIVGVAQPGAYYSTVDMAIALDHLSLRAVELGLGTCWIGDFEPEDISSILGIPSGRQVTICMTVGHPAEKPRSRSRKSKSDLFHRDKWGSPLK
jgi:nitroreductase